MINQEKIKNIKINIEEIKDIKYNQLQQKREVVELFRQLDVVVIEFPDTLYREKCDTCNLIYVDECEGIERLHYDGVCAKDLDVVEVHNWPLFVEALEIVSNQIYNYYQKLYGGGSN